MHKRVIVNLQSGRAFRGVLYETRGTLIHLKNAELIEPGMSPVPIEGSILIERGHVDFIQVVA